MRNSTIRSAGATIHWVAALLLTVGLAARAENSPPATNPLWRKIVMVGASASSGFTVNEPLGGTNTVQLRLSRHVDAALVPPCEPVLNLASSFFFMQPESSGKAQMSRALKEEPSLLLGLDFLFWYCYGKGTNDAERLLRFEQGLKLLEPVTCPLVLGDIPDASGSVNKMLRPDQIPTPAALAAANARLAAWVKARPHVMLVPLSKLITVAMRNDAYEVHGVKLPAGRTRALLQDDNLHPSAMGSAVIALAMFDALQRQFPFPESEIRWDPAAVVKSVRATARPNPPAPSRSTPAAAP